MTLNEREKELELFNAFVKKELPELFEKYNSGNFFAKVTYDSMFVAWLGAKAQAVPEWISVKDKLPEITDASVLAHFQNGSIETVHIEDWFKDITDGLDEDGRQKYTKWYLKASNTITH